MPDQDILLFMMHLLVDIESVDLKKHNSYKESAPHPNSTVVGILPEKLKRFYVVLDRMKTEFDTKYAGHFERLGNRTWEEYSPEEKAHQLRYVNDSERLQIVSGLFWQGVNEAFPDVKEDIIDICEGWQVVTLEGNRDCVGCYKRLACTSSINPWKPAPSSEAHLPN